MIDKATVVGIGAMGTTTARILAGNGVNVALLARDSEPVHEIFVQQENRRYLKGVRLSPKITPTNDPAAAFAETELIISAIPCQYLREVWRQHASRVPGDMPVVSVTKGIEIATRKRPTEIVAEHLPGHPVVALSGPNIASELIRCLPATAVAACTNMAIAEWVQGIVSTSWLRIYTSTDVVGVELAGAVKNVVALAAGILDGLQAGDNAKAALVTRGLVEITRLAVALGANPETLVGLAGVGDLITTCISPFGRNRSAGERIGRGAATNQVVEESNAVIEGIPTTQAVLELARRHGVEMPITQAVYDVLFEHKPPLVAITELMNRPLKAEDRR